MVYSFSPRIGVTRINGLTQAKEQMGRLLRPITPKRMLSDEDLPGVLIQFAQVLTALLPRTGQTDWSAKGLRVHFSPSLFGEGFFDIRVNGASLHRITTAPALATDSRPARRTETIVRLLYAIQRARAMSFPWWGKAWLWHITKPLAWLDDMDKTWKELGIEWEYSLQDLTMLIVLLQKNGISQVTMLASPKQEWLIEPLTQLGKFNVVQNITTIPKGAFISLETKGLYWWERHKQHNLCFEILL